MSLIISFLSEKQPKNFLHRFKYKLKDFTVKTAYRIELLQLFSEEERANAESSVQNYTERLHLVPPDLPA